MMLLFLLLTLCSDTHANVRFADLQNAYAKLRNVEVIQTQYRTTANVYGMKSSQEGTYTYHLKEPRFVETVITNGSKTVSGFDGEETFFHPTNDQHKQSADTAIKEWFSELPVLLTHTGVQRKERESTDGQRVIDFFIEGEEKPLASVFLEAGTGFIQKITRGGKDSQAFTIQDWILVDGIPFPNNFVYKSESIELTFQHLNTELNPELPADFFKNGAKK